jgi:hypothetical protein
MILSWFDAKEVQQFGDGLARFIMKELPADDKIKEGKFAVKTQRTLKNAAQKVQRFKTQNSLNVYKKAKLSNAFLWGLRDAGCPQDYADELTRWLTLQLQGVAASNV